MDGALSWQKIVIQERIQNLATIPYNHDVQWWCDDHDEKLILSSWFNISYNLSNNDNNLQLDVLKLNLPCWGYY